VQQDLAITLQIRAHQFLELRFVHVALHGRVLSPRVNDVHVHLQHLYIRFHVLLVVDIRQELVMAVGVAAL
jgi:hypothetical protein